MLPPVVMWIDPGLMTGLAWMWNGRQFQSGEYGFMEASRLVEWTCATYGDSCWVGWERFTIGPRTPPVDAHHAIEMIGVTRMWAQRFGCRILTPGQQATPKPPEQRALKQLGWWLPGRKDAQSAAGHMLRWLIAEGEAPPAVREAIQITGRT